MALEVDGERAYESPAITGDIAAIETPRINLTGAETASNIAEITVFDDRVEVALEVYVGDLKTFEVSLGHSIEALPALPDGAVKIAESGIESGGDVARLFEAGFDAFLIGESLLLAEDPAAKLQELSSGAFQ